MHERNPVSWRTSAPFIVCHFLPFIGLYWGSTGATSSCSSSSTWCGCSSSPPATTATSPTSRTGSGASSSSCSPSAARPRRRRARCGGPPTTAPTTATPTPTRDLHSPAARLLVEPRRLDPVRRVRRDRLRRHPGLRALSRAALPEPLRLDRSVGARLRLLLSAAGAACSSASSARPCCSGTPRSRSTRSPTSSAGAATTPPTPAATPSPSRCSLRRGLAQQPPPLSAVGPPGLLLVGDRPHLLRAPRARVARARARPASTDCRGAGIPTGDNEGMTRHATAYSWQPSPG